MYFSKIILQEDARHSPKFWTVFRTPYTLHQSIWSLFGDHVDRKRDFLYRVDQDGQRPVIYSVSEREPDHTKDLWCVESKPYSPKINAGMKLAFMLRVNPVVTRRDAGMKQHRHDVVMDLKARLREQEKFSEKRNKSQAEIVQEAGWDWLAARSENNGFSVNQNQIRVESYRQEQFVKKKGGRRIKFSSLDFFGGLTVVDPVLFIERLFRGLGPAKAFGCGLMLVKRI